MKIKSAKAFREWFKNNVAGTIGSNFDEDFIGNMYEGNNGSAKYGFFKMYHGDKEDIHGFLTGTGLKVAEDGQAIYEFLQNAADCGSSLFHMFYDETSFLAINNGSAFSKAGIKSILNVAQSIKRGSTQIGRFGIGFKLVHRLVGKGDGSDELMRDYKGPVLFSWSRKEDLLALMNNEPIEPHGDIEDDSQSPWFFKILITNFPASVGEPVRDLNYSERVLFTPQEYREMSAFVKAKLGPLMERGNVDLNQGSLFFIKLGEGKSALLDKDRKENFEQGVEYSLNLLKNLKSVEVNGDEVVKRKLEMESGEVKMGTEAFEKINPEYKDANISFSVGYNKIDFDADAPFAAVNALKAAPAFYKFFPIGDETHRSAVMIHCDSFNNANSRRKLTEDVTNTHLFPEIAKFITGRLDEYKKTDRPRFLQLYANLLLSEKASDNSQWLNGVYYNTIEEYLKANIPTKGDFCSNVKNVGIRKVDSVIADNPDICNGLQWFEWEDKGKLKDLTGKAESKLGIKDVRIGDFLKRCSKDALETWVAQNYGTEAYLNLLKEINDNCGTNLRETLRKIKLFKFSDGSFRSYDDVVAKNIIYSSYSFSYKGNAIFLNGKLDSAQMAPVLNKLGIATSLVNASDYSNIFRDEVRLPDDKQLFELVMNAADADAKLSVSDKRTLIGWLKGANRPEGIGSESIKKLRICRNACGHVMQLGQMVEPNLARMSWLKPFAIGSEEYFTELNDLLIAPKRIYADIIFPKWDEIIENVDPNGPIAQFYRDVRHYHSLDESHIASLSGKRTVLCANGKFESKVFYSPAMPTDPVAFERLRGAIDAMVGLPIPRCEVLTFLSEAPFGTAPAKLCDQTTREDTIDEAELRELLAFAENNGESFFAKFVVKQKGERYVILSRSESLRQAYTGKKDLADFIASNCGSMVLLPKCVELYREKEGILKGDELQDEILKEVRRDIDDLKEELIDLLNEDHRRKLVLMLDECRFDLDKAWAPDGFEVKLVEAAMGLNAEAAKTLRAKTLLIKDGNETPLADIPADADEFSVDGALIPFPMSQILPDLYAKSDLLGALIDKLDAAHLSKEKVKSLFGIGDEVDANNVWEKMQEHSDGKELNVQQLAFALIMGDGLGNFSVRTLGKASQSLSSGPFYVKSHIFLDENYLLDDCYSDLAKYVDLPKNGVYAEPYIEDGEFHLDGLKDEMDDEAKAALLDFLHALRKDGKDISCALPKVEMSLFGKERVMHIATDLYALEDERTPAFVIEWANGGMPLPDYVGVWEADDDRKKTLQALNVLFDDSPVVRLRKFFKGEINFFDKDELVSCSRNELESTLEWLAEDAQWTIADKGRHYIFKEVVNRINKERGAAPIERYDEVNFDALSQNSTEITDDNVRSYAEWSEKNNFRIFLHNGPMPRTVRINEYFDDRILWNYSEGDVAANGADIYINGNNMNKIKSILLNFALGNEIGLEDVHVYKLFDAETEALRYRVKELEEMLDDYLVSRPKDWTPKINDDINKLNREAKEKVFDHLERMGFSVPDDAKCHWYSTVDGVTKDDTLYPLVIKSCRNANGKLWLNPAEWDKLSEENSMLWVYFGNINGNDILCPIDAHQLFGGKLTVRLTFSTKNLEVDERLAKFMETMRFFKDTHLEIGDLSASGKSGHDIEACLFRHPHT